MRCARRSTPRGWRRASSNFGEWSAHLVHRLRLQAAITGDPELQELLAELLGYPNVQADPPPADTLAAAEIVLPLRIRHRGHSLSFTSTVTTFGTAADVTLAELTVEAFYPADAQTAAALAGA